MSHIQVAPVNVDPEDILSIAFELDTDKLATTLHRISQTVARNARVTNTTHEQMENLRMYVDTNINKVQRMVTVVDESTRSMKEQMTRIHDDIKLLQAQSVKKEEFEHDKALLWSSAKRAEHFIDEVEGGSADRVSRLIKTYVETYLPKWFEGIQSHLWVKIRQELAHLKEAMGEQVQEDLAVVETKLFRSVDEVRDGYSYDVKQIRGDARETYEKLSKMVEDVEKNFQESLDAMQRTSNASALEFSMRFEPRLSQVELGTKSLKDLLGVDATHDGPAEESDSKLKVLGASDLVAVEEKDVHVKDQQTSSRPVPASPQKRGSESGTPPPKQSPASTPQQHSLKMMNQRPSLSTSKRVDFDFGRKPSATPTTSDVPLTPTPPPQILSDEHVKPQRKMPHDPSVERILKSAPFAALKAHILEQQQETAEQSARELSQELHRVKADVDTALADKVGLGTLQDLLHRYRDETLYSNVKNSQQEIEKLKQEKVDLSALQSLLRDKSERTDLELKLDKTYFNTVQLQVDSRIDEMGRAIASVAEAMEKDKATLRQLQENVANADMGSFKSGLSAGRHVSNLSDARRQSPSGGRTPDLGGRTPTVINLPGHGGRSSSPSFRHALTKPSTMPSFNESLNSTPPEVKSPTHHSMPRPPGSASKTFSELLFRTKPEDFAKPKPPKHTG